MGSQNHELGNTKNENEQQSEGQSVLNTVFHASDYDDLIASAQWSENLNGLNHYIVDALERVGEPAVLNGNLFYGHKVKDFHRLSADERFEPKRRNFFELARRSSSFFEIGVNGGHSMLLAMMANPNLKCVGVDVCAKLSRNWARVDIYVPAVFDWFKYKFPGQVRMIKGNSLVEVPSYQIENTNEQIDFLHLDGAKDTHLREVLSIERMWSPGAFVVHDDFNLKPVRRSDRQLRKLGVTQPLDYASFGLVESANHIVRVKT